MTVPPGAVIQALTDAHRRERAFVPAATVRIAGVLKVVEACVQRVYTDATTAWTK